MTVHSLERAQQLVTQYPEGIAAVYEYYHAISGDKLYSVESHVNAGATEKSGYVLSPRLIWTPELGWSKGYAPLQGA